MTNDEIAIDRAAIPRAGKYARSKYAHILAALRADPSLAVRVPMGTFNGNAASAALSTSFRAQFPNHRLRTLNQADGIYIWITPKENK